MAPENDNFSSLTNPNGLYENFLDGSIKERFPDQKDRLAIAVADIKAYLTETIGVDLEIAEVIAARAAYEIVLSLDTSLLESDVKDAFELGASLADRAAVERAIEDILD